MTDNTARPGNGHSRFEFASVQYMEKVTELLLKLAEKYAAFRQM